MLRKKLSAVHYWPNAFTSLCPAVYSLLVRCSPTAIARLIVSVAIDSVETATKRAMSHIGKEILKLLPAIAYLDSTPAIVGVFRGRRSLTT